MFDFAIKLWQLAIKVCTFFRNLMRNYTESHAINIETSRINIIYIAVVMLIATYLKKMKPDIYCDRKWRNSQAQVGKLFIRRIQHFLRHIQ